MHACAQATRAGRIWPAPFSGQLNDETPFNNEKLEDCGSAGHAGGNSSSSLERQGHSNQRRGPRGLHTTTQCHPLDHSCTVSKTTSDTALISDDESQRSVPTQTACLAHQCNSPVRACTRMGATTLEQAVFNTQLVTSCTAVLLLTGAHRCSWGCECGCPGSGSVPTAGGPFATALLEEPLGAPRWCTPPPAVQDGWRTPSRAALAPARARVSSSSASMLHKLRLLVTR